MAALLVQEEGFICVVGLAQPRSNEKTRMVKKYFMHTPYLFLVHNFLSQVGRSQDSYHSSAEFLLSSKLDMLDAATGCVQEASEPLSVKGQ